MTTKEQAQKQGFGFTEKLILYLSLFVCVFSIVNLFQGIFGFEWSSELKEFSLPYAVVFHMLPNWIFSWLNITLYWWAIDILVAIVSFSVTFNFMLIQFFGYSYWRRARENSKQSLGVSLGSILNVLIVSPIVSLLIQLRNQGNMSNENIAYFKTWGAIILLAIVLLGVNFAFLKIGL